MAEMATKMAFDIIIVGGGPVGLTLGASLAHYMPGLEIAICDRRTFEVPRDARASAIAAGVQQVFEGIDLWGDIAPHATPIMRMHITDSGGGDLARPLFLSFEGNVAPGRPFAHMVPNMMAADALLNRVCNQVTLFGSVEVQNLEVDAHGAHVALSDGQTLCAPLVVAADGVRSSLRTMSGIATTGHAYNQTGIVTTIQHELDHAQTAYEHFRPAGPFASLPLKGKRSSLVWTETHQDALRYKALPGADLAARIARVMGSSLGHVIVDDLVQTFPLRLQIARQFHGKRLVLVGDAAHVVHPISGQGLNLGLKDVAVLCEVLIDALRLGQDHGAEDVLARYTQWRRFDTALMAMATDGLNRLFSNDVPPVRALRDAGLGVVDRLPLVKTALIRHAAGIGGALPKLMRGQRL